MCGIDCQYRSQLITEAKWRKQMEEALSNIWNRATAQRELTSIKGCKERLVEVAMTARDGWKMPADEGKDARLYGAAPRLLEAATEMIVALRGEDISSNAHSACLSLYLAVRDAGGEP